MPEAARGWKARWRRQRNRLIGSRTFQRLAARLPIARQIGARQARALFDLTAGFVYSQTLFCLVQSDLFAFLKDGPKTTAEIACFIDVPIENADRLLRAAVELDLLAMHADGWWLADLGAVMASNAGVRAMVRHHAMLYEDLRDPLTMLRGETETRTKRFWSYAGSAASVTDATASAYSDLMTASQDLIIDEVLAAYRFSRHRALLDIGGGEGRFVAAVANRYPDIRLTVFDLPAVAGRVRQRQTEGSVSAQVAVTSGDFFRDDLPSGADLTTLIRVLCDHDDGPALTLLRRIHDSMRAGDMLLIAEPMGGRDGGAGRAAAYFGLYFLAMQSGRSRTPAEIRHLLSAAGFAHIRRVRTRQPLLASILVATA